MPDTFAAFLRKPSTTQLLRAMLADNKRVDALLDGQCIGCGLSIRLHRLPNSAQVSCAEARDRFFLVGEA